MMSMFYFLYGSSKSDINSWRYDHLKSTNKSKKDLNEISMSKAEGKILDFISN